MAKIASIIFVISVALIIVAFWPLYLSRPFASIDRYTHLHAAAGSLWFLLLIAQTRFVSRGRIAVHRALGFSSYLLAPLFVLSAILLSNYRLRSMDDATFLSEGFSHYLPFSGTLIFAVAFALGIWYRHLPSTHGRFLLCTALPLIDPVLGRILGFYLPPFPRYWVYQTITFSLAAVIAGILVWSFRGTVSSRRALIGFFSFLVVIEAGWFAFAPTSAWLKLVGWFRSLPIT